jgi:hypothetical protein
MFPLFLFTLQCTEDQAVVRLQLEQLQFHILEKLNPVFVWGQKECNVISHLSVEKAGASLVHKELATVWR